MKELAVSWSPSRDDKNGKDQKAFLNYIIENGTGIKNAKTIETILNNVVFSRAYSTNEFQHQILVPLREVGKFFIGTSGKGVYFIESAEDAYKTIEFYTTRIRSESKHLRNLKTIVRQNRLFDDFTAPMPKALQRNVFMDESGRPSLDDIKNDPYFIVSSVVVDAKHPIRTIDKKLQFIRDLLGKPDDYEFKSNSLKDKDYEVILKELSTIDYEFGAVCFLKENITGEGFNYPRSFYAYAFRFLVDSILDYVGAANLYFDQYSNKGSKFEASFLEYIKKHSLGFPVNKIDHTDMVSSDTSPWVQFADLLAGVIRRKAKGRDKLFNLIEDRAIFIEFFPRHRR